MAYDNFPDLEDTSWNFTDSQWKSVADAGKAAAIISFIANSCVLIVHGFMSWHRPAVVNRLSLRMIVFSCICNMLYCASQIVTDNISAQSTSCRALAYVTIISDTMACMCLAMVGFNLVMIFALKVPRSLKSEVIYYLIVLLSGAIEILKVQDTRIDTYHAAICAAISIWFVAKKQQRFTGALNVFTRRKQRDVETIAVLRKYIDRNIDVFQKIALRCTCYPLVPLFSKSWGVAIEIAASQNSNIPYAVFVLDRLSSCLLDPAINAVFKEFVDNVKRNYVFDYYIVRCYSQSSQPTPKLVKVTVMSKESVGASDLLDQARRRYFSQGSADTHKSEIDHSHPQGQKIPSMELVTIHGRPVTQAFSDSRRYSIVTAMDKDGHSFFPEEHLEDNAASLFCKRRVKYKDIPMKSLSTTSTLLNNKFISTVDESIDQQNTSVCLKEPENVETLQKFKFPLLAKLIHWSLVYLFRIRPYRNELGSENTESGAQSRHNSQSPKRNLGSSNKDDHVPINKHTLPKQSKETNSTSIFSSDFDFNARHRFKDKSIDSLKRTFSIGTTQTYSVHPLRRVSSIAVTCTQPFRTQEKPLHLHRKSDTESKQQIIQNLLKHGRSMSLGQEKQDQQSTPTSCPSPSSSIPSQEFRSKESSMSELSDEEQTDKESIHTERMAQPNSDVEFPIQLSPRPKSQYIPLKSLEHIKKAQATKRFSEGAIGDRKFAIGWQDSRTIDHSNDLASTSVSLYSHNEPYSVQNMHMINAASRRPNVVSNMHHFPYRQDNQLDTHIIDMFGSVELQETIDKQKEIADDIERL
ncbi:hypothetical protein BD560DRAFT_428607 [Blakeslea trispora]|nr:hypothetical protein BD560DRAFT_428607 [Blakeslea trispora]